MSLKIMVVDDEPRSLKVMRSLTVPLGHKVVTLDDSRAASEQAHKSHFDVVFVGMPRQDGQDALEIVREIRNAQPENKTSVVMLCPAGDAKALRDAFSAGVTFALPKPITSSRVLSMLAAMESPRWKESRHAARLPLLTEVNCKSGEREFLTRSLNISETGMLLESPQGLREGQEISLQFSIKELQARFDIRARVIRMDGNERAGVEFVGLAPEQRNAIQLYVLGHLNDAAPRRPVADKQIRTFLNPRFGL